MSENTARDVASLIDRLSKATCGSGELDDAIYECARGYKKAGACYVKGGMCMETFWLTGAPHNVIGGQIMIGRSPMFTFRLDDARSLLGAGIEFLVQGPGSEHQTPHSGYAEAWRQDNYVSKYSPQFHFEARARTPEIALCIVALRIVALQRQKVTK